MKPHKRLALRLGAVGAALALSTVGLVAIGVSSAGATTITETFGGSGPTGPLELQVPESITAAATSVTQGNTIQFTVPGGSQVVPSTQSGVAVNYINNLHTIVPIPAQTTFSSVSAAGNWSFTNASGVTTTGAMSLTECTASGTTGCDATLAASSTFLGPNGATGVTGTNDPATTAGGPYIESSTGSATFSAGGTLTTPSWTFTVTATGSGSFSTTVSEFDTNANITLSGVALNVSITGYPAVADTSAGGCLAATVTSCTQQPYQFQPINTITINSPPAAPVLVPQTGNVSAGQCTTINPLNGATDTGSGDSADPSTVTVTSGPTNGTTSVDTTTGIITYCNTGGTAATDTFTVTACDTLASPCLVSAPVTETINISYNQCSAGSGTAGTSTGTLTPCSLHQEIVLPVTPGQIILSQASGLPLDYLGSAECAGTPTPGITLNGNEQAACGAVSPVTVTNATGLDTGWTLTGQTTDFTDPAAPGITCDTVATYNNHCIPGGNLAWQPDSYVSDSIVPGDTGLVTSGAIIAPFTPVAPVASTDPIMQGAATQPTNPVVEPAPNSGLQASPQTMCSTQAGQSGGTFTCGAGLELLVPASVAEPGLGAYGAPAYQASLTLTLS